MHLTFAFTATNIFADRRPTSVQHYNIGKFGQYTGSKTGNSLKRQKTPGAIKIGA